MHGDIATAPKHTVQFGNKELERGEKFLVVLAVAHVFEFVGICVQFGKRRAEYREPHALIGHRLDKLDAIPESNVAIFGFILSVLARMAHFHFLLDVAVHRLGHLMLHVEECRLFIVKSVFYVLHCVGCYDMDIYTLGLPETVGTAYALVSRFKAERGRGKYLIVAILVVQTE